MKFQRSFSNISYLHLVKPISQKTTTTKNTVSALRIFLSSVWNANANLFVNAVLCITWSAFHHLFIKKDSLWLICHLDIRHLRFSLKLLQNIFNLSPYLASDNVWLPVPVSTFRHIMIRMWIQFFHFAISPFHIHSHLYCISKWGGNGP